MSDPNIGRIVAEAWDAAQKAADGPGYFVVLETKDGRRFVTHVQYLGVKTIDCLVEYRPRKNSRRGYGPVYTGHFDLAHDEAVRVSHRALTVWRQRRGPNEPRFDRVPETWCPLDRAPKNLDDIRPKPINYFEMLR